MWKVFKQVFIFYLLFSSFSSFSDVCPQSLTELLGLVRQGRFEIRDLNDGFYAGGDHHPHDGRLEAYSKTFAELLANRSFADWIKKRKSKEKSTHILDLMGSGPNLESFDQVDSITGVRLMGGKEILSIAPQRPDWKIIFGDLFNSEVKDEFGIFEGDPTVWKKLDQSMKKRRISGFDLITIRPLNGDPGIEYHSRFVNFIIVLRNAYLRLSRDQGEMYIHFSRGDERIFQIWSDHLRESGVDVTYKKRRMRIIKDQNSPKILPANIVNLLR